MEEYQILTINPGSQSTKIAVFKGNGKGIEPLLEEEFTHSKDELAKFDTVFDQKKMKTAAWIIPNISISKSEKNIEDFIVSIDEIEEKTKLDFFNKKEEDEENPSIEINVVDPTSRKGFRFKGDSTILSSGPEFEKIISHYNTMGVKSKINKAVKIRIKEVSEITSPLYDLGFSEEEIKKRWKDHYLSF